MNLKLIAGALLVAVSGACGTSAETERKLAELELANAQKDSLMQEIALSSRLLSDVSVEIAKVQVRGNRLAVSSESPLTAQRDTMLAKLRYVVTRVRQTEQQLGQSRARIRNLTSLSDSLRGMLDSTVTNLQTVIAEQKSTIDWLTQRVETLTAENLAMSDSLSIVYYVIGTRDELKQRGLLVEEGGSRVLFILWRTGRTLAPARNLDPSLFTAVDKRATIEIPLPDSTAEYRIASRQNLDALATPRKGNRVRDVPSLQIASPEDFWRNSRFLIIVLEGQTNGTAD
ncbi:MAG: hypothetical protein Q8R92_15810 [Deltaproteobacteria bacterium]|nr:hypothetical protein [Deltaproteobacteria bacterium]